MTFPLRFRTAAYSLVLVAASLMLPARADEPAKTKSAPSPAQSTPAEPDLNELYRVGKQLFEEYAPDEVKKDYEFPSIDQWNAFAGRLQKALQGDSLSDLAAFEPEARSALAALRALPDGGDYADWLAERLDLIESARDAGKPRAPQRPEAPLKPGEKPEPAPAARVSIPHYDLWLNRLRDRPPPDQAAELLPRLKTIFRDAGLPPELAWLAEVESSLNPAARSPAGARGLYQLMPDTAKSLGLSLFPFDERSQPEKNARAAARLLRQLHGQFHSWPLALAAYNAGAGRVSRALEKSPQATFTGIAPALSAETRMYVPKVLATVTVREKVAPDQLAAPREVGYSESASPALAIFEP
jgi:membrane-bound lytic murein transglycosylase D